eukprot:1134012-Rhodomonas_salina.2
MSGTDAGYAATRSLRELDLSDNYMGSTSPLFATRASSTNLGTAANRRRGCGVPSTRATGVFGARIVRPEG